VPPETRYARSGDVHIAYQVVGNGPLDLVMVPGFVTHLDMLWEEPALTRFLGRLASFSRLILLDKRGTGLSDRVQVATLEERMDDVRAVLEAVGSERAALLGVSEGGPMSVLFAATYPERTAALALYGSFARFTQAPGYPWSWSMEALEGMFAQIEAQWGTGMLLPTFAPGLAGDERAQAWMARFERMAASPGATIAVLRMNIDIDVRHVLPAIRVPTLVLHRSGDLVINVACGRHLAEHIPGARYVELPGQDHLPSVDGDAITDEVQEFLTGVRGAPEPDRVLSTVLFTDMVDSTGRVAALGDRGWRELLETHHAIVRKELTRFRGHEVDTAGDGFLATFDGPARAVRCASATRDALRGVGIDIRAGLHTGECELMGERVGGIAVHIGARVAAAAAPGEILVSSTVKDLVAGSGLRFVDRGVHTLKGLPDAWRLYAVAA
jgi:pimeloyl-ACP methyl ester carboxylesterase